MVIVCIAGYLGAGREDRGMREACAGEYLPILRFTHVVDVFAGVCCHIPLEAAISVAQVHSCTYVPIH